MSEEQGTMARFVTAAIIVIMLFPMFFVGSIGGIGLAMVAGKFEGSSLVGVLLVGAMLLVFWGLLRLIERVSKSRMGQSEFWKVSTTRVWKFAAFTQMTIGAVGTAMALFQA